MNMKHNLSSLPEPNVLLAEKSHRLQELIQNEIARNQGSILFSDYMDLALYTPELGYYSGTMQKFGKSGDFVTAPEISPLFSRCLAGFCQNVLRNFNDENKRNHGDILEIGAGSGQMALDILVELYRQNALPRHYYIYEISPELSIRQQHKLREGLAEHCGEEGVEIFSRVIWIDVTYGHYGLPKASFQGVILANEVLDALPVDLFTIKNGTVYLNHVVIRNGKFEMELHEPNEPSTQYSNWQSHDEIECLISSKTDYHSEINFTLDKILENIANLLHSGVVLFIDYGFPRQEYYHPDRFMGTLMCHYQHRAHTDPFYYPGLQDITAHVDFTAVALAADAANLQVAGYTNQASFLIDAGLIQLLEREKFLGAQSMQLQKITQNQAMNLLTSPAEMGELFKVMALCKNYEEELIGFRNDLRNRL